MKKHIIIPISLVILSSTPVSLMAASAITAYQQGNSNQLSVVQSGMLNSTAAIDQNGSDLATINQIGTSAVTPNSVAVVQDGTLPILRNSITIEQKAGANAASIYQTSLIPASALVSPYSRNPFATVGLGDNTGGVAYGNTATAIQNSTGNELGIIQKGHSNTATFVQESDNLGIIVQIGNTNRANINQAIGSSVNATTINDINAVIVQIGNNDTANIVQNSLGTFNSAIIWQAKTSHDSVANVTQSGAYNFANVKQSGTLNTATVSQSGFGVANGAENRISIIQTGYGADTATATQSHGDTNTIDITQSRGDGSSVSVSQDGFAMTATVRQH